MDFTNTNKFTETILRANLKNIKESAGLQNVDFAELFVFVDETCKAQGGEVGFIKKMLFGLFAEDITDLLLLKTYFPDVFQCIFKTPTKIKSLAFILSRIINNENVVMTFINKGATKNGSRAN